MQVSIQAFLQQVQNWSMSLNRESKKLFSQKPKIKNKFKINSIQIILTQIQSQQIKYKKIRQQYQKYTNDQNLNVTNFNQEGFSDHILKQYSILSRIFMDILERISALSQEQDQENPLLEHFDHKSKNTKINQEKTFLNQTFAYKSSKHQNKKVNKSLFEKRKNSQIKQTTNRQISFHKGQSFINPSNLSNITNINLNKVGKKSLIYEQQQQSKSLWQIRLQLSQIKQMMKQMQSQIKYHQHQQTTKQLTKFQNNNRKLATSVKQIKQSNRIISLQLQQISKTFFIQDQQLINQKKTQLQLIKRYQKKCQTAQDSLYKNNDSRRTYNRQNTSQRHNRQTQQKTQNISDWVKIRI